MLPVTYRLRLTGGREMPTPPHAAQVSNVCLAKASPFVYYEFELIRSTQVKPQTDGRNPRRNEKHSLARFKKVLAKMDERERELMKEIMKKLESE
jgi:hypothetical protein